MKRIFYVLVFLFSLFFISPNVFSQAGKDGARTITAANTVVNNYSSLRLAGGGAGSVTLASGSTTINHAGGFTLTPGDLVMIIQIQGGSGFTMDQTTTSATYGNITNYGNAGVYELRVVQSVPSSTSFVVDRGLTNTYVSTTLTGSGNNARAQVVKIPRYSALTINAGASIVPTSWSTNNGVGGIVAIEVSGTTTINGTGTINANGAGFRGGVVQNSSNATVPTTNVDYAITDQTRGAAKGGSIAGSTTFDPTTFAVTGTLPGPIYGRGAPANGGGGGN
ncbi:MAG: hypothetical protein M3Q05_07175, partial [Bacteroidota bacterium]|nr:hypothetical protein [Bacteroidota bacterium]